MKSLEEVRSRVETQMKDPASQLYIKMCSGIHPLSVFLVEYYRDDFKDEVIPLTEENIIMKMGEYMEIAQGKGSTARDVRGLLFERSVWKYQQWLWALEDEELLALAIDDMNWNQRYILSRICKKYKFPKNRSLYDIFGKEGAKSKEKPE